MYECERTAGGSLRVTVFVEAWLVNDARLGLAYRDLGTVGGEHLIYELGHRVKDRGGAAAQRIYALGTNLRERGIKAAWYPEWEQGFMTNIQDALLKSTPVDAAITASADLARQLAKG